MATKNTRNAALLLANAVGGPYTKVNKTHGLSTSLTTEFSESTGHGQRFASNTPGIQDYTMTIAKWYDTAQFVLEQASFSKAIKYFQYYPDYADPQNYDTGACYISQDEQNSDLGQTTDQSYSMVLADTDPILVREGTPLT